MNAMPFGKFKGTPIAELPAPYVAWLSQQDLRDPLKALIEAEAERRARTSPAPPDRAIARSADEPLDARLRGDEERVTAIRCPRCGHDVDAFLRLVRR